MPRRRLATLLLILVAAGLLAPAGALAQSAPFAPLPQAPPDTSTQAVTVAPTTANSDSGGLSRGAEIAIFIGGVALVIGIGWAILHDARRRAPVRDEKAYYRETSATPDDPHKAQRKAKNRKRAKAQRVARRHNR